MPNTNAAFNAPSIEEFEALLNGTFGVQENPEGTVVRGRIVEIDREAVIIDVGLKTEGRVNLKEFQADNNELTVKVGDMVDVYVERYENTRGEAVLSRDKARREETWVELEKAQGEARQVEGVIFSRVKGGFTVDLNGATAFLPGSQVDVRPLRDISHIMNIPQKFLVLKMDYNRGNIVVSRRAVLEEQRAEQRAEIVENLAEGQIVEGVVKNITDYGVFIDLGGVDGLLHVTDISWKRINHPSEALSLGESVKVIIIKISDNKRLSLGIKQLEADPWSNVDGKFKVGERYKGKVTNITDYGAFVELDNSIEGLIHISELSWTKKSLHPQKSVSIGEEVEVMILEIDLTKRRISLGMKQCLPNPWENFAAEHAPGTEITGEVRNITEFGLFIAVSDEIDGMVHLNDLSRTEPGEAAIKKYKKGETVTAKILEVDIDKERVALGIKQLDGEDDSASSNSRLKKGDTVTCSVKNVTDNGLEVMIEDIEGFIRKAELSRDRSEQRPQRFAVGDKIDAKVIGMDRGKGASLSIKALEIEEEKEAVAQYGSADSGASLGDILGAALRKKEEQDKNSEKS